MKPAQQLEWEARNGPKFAALAFAGAAFVILSFAIQVSTFRGASGNKEVLLRINDHGTQVLIGRICEGISTVFIVAALYFLLRAVLARRSAGLGYLSPVLLLAPLLLIGAAVIGHLDATDAAQRFASGAHTAARAKDVANDLASPLTKGLGQAGGLCLGLSYVLVSVNAMRAGLLSRFMGILGIIAGALIVLPVLPGAIIQTFWLLALGMLFLDRWPNGRGPAWSVVEAIPWPTAAQTRELAGGDGEPVTAAEASQPGTPADANGASERPARRRSSRKKKRRR